MVCQFSPLVRERSQPPLEQKGRDKLQLSVAEAGPNYLTQNGVLSNSVSA